MTGKSRSAAPDIDINAPSYRPPGKEKPLNQETDEVNWDLWAFLATIVGLEPFVLMYIIDVLSSAWVFLALLWMLVLGVVALLLWRRSSNRYGALHIVAGLLMIISLLVAAFLLTGWVLLADCLPDLESCPPGT